MVFVSVSETYDLHTKAGKMTLIGVHTPTRDIIMKTYPGLCMNAKFCRIVSQDVVIACASVMPFSADIVGTGADDIAPEDAFNPILYKAVSNESMSTLEYRLQGLGLQRGSAQVTQALLGPSVDADNDSVTGLADEFNVYYALLSNRAGFKTASPQQGLTMTGLTPLVFEKWYVQANNTGADGSNPVIGENVNNPGQIVKMNQGLSGMRGKAHPMPRFNTTYLTAVDGAYVSGSNDQNGMADGKPYNAQVMMPNIPPVYTAMIVMPPSKQHTLYYRMVVRTTLEFTEVRPIQEIASFASLSTDYAPLVYQSDYDEQSKVMTAKEGMVDVSEGSVTKIMEGA